MDNYVAPYDSYRAFANVSSNVARPDFTGYPGFPPRFSLVSRLVRRGRWRGDRSARLVEIRNIDLRKLSLLRAIISFSLFLSFFLCLVVLVKLYTEWNIVIFVRKNYFWNVVTMVEKKWFVDVVIVVEMLF